MNYTISPRSKIKLRLRTVNKTKHFLLFSDRFYYTLFPTTFVPLLYDLQSTSTIIYLKVITH